MASNLILTLEITLRYHSSQKLESAAAMLSAWSPPGGGDPASLRRQGLDGLKSVDTDFPNPTYLKVVTEVGVYAPANAQARILAQGFAIGKIVGWLGGFEMVPDGFTHKVIGFRDATAADLQG